MEQIRKELASTGISAFDVSGMESSENRGEMSMTWRLGTSRE